MRKRNKWNRIWSQQSKYINKYYAQYLLFIHTNGSHSTAQHTVQSIKSLGAYFSKLLFLFHIVYFFPASSFSAPKALLFLYTSQWMCLSYVPILSENKNETFYKSTWNKNWNVNISFWLSQTHSLVHSFRVHTILLKKTFENKID